MKKVLITTITALAFLSVSAISAFADSKIVGFSQVDNQNPWRLAETESIKSEAKARGYKLKYSDGQAVQANQIAAVRDFIAQGVDGIILAPKTSTGWEPVPKGSTGGQDPRGPGRSGHRGPQRSRGYLYWLGLRP